MSAALALGQPLAGAVVALMYSGGNVRAQLAWIVSVGSIREAFTENGFGAFDENQIASICKRDADAIRLTLTALLAPSTMLWQPR